MRRTVYLLLVMLVVAAYFIWQPGRDDSGYEAEGSLTTREITAAQLLTRVEQRTRALRLRTARDVLPGGFAAAMAPLIIDWQASRPEGPEGFIVIHNLNYGGNPVDGFTVLQAARVPVYGVAAAEFTLVPLDNIGRRGLVHHGQLRFLFAEAKPIELLDFSGQEAGSDPTIDDLVISWEAWRPVGVDFNMMVGMDPEAYQLTPRAYAGGQRFLEDALGKRDWYSYTLRLPGGTEGLAELLRVSLALSDGVARHTVSKLFALGAEEWARHAPRAADGSPTGIEQWQALQEIVSPHGENADPRINLPEAEQSYQTLLRSCATMALYSINLAVDRLVNRGLTDGVILENRMLPELARQEPWMLEITQSNLPGVFVRAPYALRFLHRHPEAMPSNIPERLDAAGLLQHSQGKRVEIHYSLHGQTPYGSLKSNLIR